MNISHQLSKQLHDVYFGGNWTSVNMREVTADITWQEANSSINKRHSIGELVYHTAYFLKAVQEALENKPLSTKDSESFNVQSINSDEEWNSLLHSVWNEVNITCRLIDSLSDEDLATPFVLPQYGTIFRNIAGIIEHTHYHLGQIVLIKQDIRTRGNQK